MGMLKAEKYAADLFEVRAHPKHRPFKKFLGIVDAKSKMVISKG